MVEKPIPAIPMNYDNQTVIIKVNSSKDNMKSSRHVKRRLKSVKKMRTPELLRWIISKHLKIWQIPPQRVYHVM
jgi:hypothetical protein